MNGRFLVDGDDMTEFMQNYVKIKKAEGLDDEKISSTIGRFYTNKIIKKYSKPEMDSMWSEIVDIVNSDGGVGWLIQNMDYMPEFEHPKFKGLKSASKTKGL